MQKIGVFTLGAALFVGVSFVHAGGETVELKDRKSDGPSIKSKVPAGWKAQTPKSTLRLYQFGVPKVEGDKEDAEVAIFSFGASGKDANLKRWKMQFIAPEGKSIDEVSKVEEYKIGKIADVVCLDITGTFKSRNPPQDPNAKEVLKQNYRRFNVMIETDSSTYFITLTGPAKTMAKNKAAFDGWIKAFK